MKAKKYQAFISYARADGEDFATSLRKRLEAEEPEIPVWQDRAGMSGGIDWWRQIQDAIEESHYLVMVMTPGALRSKVTRDEWLYARRHAVCVVPVMGVPPDKLDFESLPRWMAKAHFFNLEKEWERFKLQLKSPCAIERVPHMAPEPPEDYVHRPTEYDSLLTLILDKDKRDPVAITTALRGSGGFGKTTLAMKLCDDDEVITAYSDGILWVTLGQTPNITDTLTKLYAALTGERPQFVDEEDATAHLAERLRGKDCLVVFDDVWRAGHLAPLLRASNGRARLITTRHSEVATAAQPVPVDEMTSSEAVDLLLASLEERPADLKPFRDLAGRMGEWPLLLSLAGASLGELVKRGRTLRHAVDHLNTALDKRGVQAFDRRDPQQRDESVALTVEVSLSLLEPEECLRYTELAIFPEDVDIPLSAVGRLWGLDDFETDEQALRLHGLSLLHKLDLASRTMQLHDVMRDFLASRLVDTAGTHARLVDTWGDLHSLPDAYAWQWIGYHLNQAGRHDTLRQLLLDYDWLTAKLEATSVNSLISDYDALAEDKPLNSLQSALRLSSHILVQYPDQLPEQLTGRLLAAEDPDITQLLDQAGKSKAVWLRPIRPCFTQPGGAELRTLSGHGDWVRAVSLTADGRRAVSGSDDGTLKVWDVESGQELRTLTGHGDCVRAVSLTADGRRAVSGSHDKTLKVWDVESGQELRTLTGHGGWVRAVSLTADGRRAVSASS